MGYSALVNYQSRLLNSVPLPPPSPLFFSIKYCRNRLLPVSFLELQDFMTYQLVNKRNEILPFAIFTYSPSRLCNQLNHVFALPIFMPQFKSINFHQIGLWMSFFCKKLQNFWAKISQNALAKYQLAAQTNFFSGKSRLSWNSLS